LHFALFRYRTANEHLGLDQSCFLQTIVHDNKERTENLFIYSRGGFKCCGTLLTADHEKRWYHLLTLLSSNLWTLRSFSSEYTFRKMGSLMLK